MTAQLQTSIAWEVTRRIEALISRPRQAQSGAAGLSLRLPPTGADQSGSHKLTSTRLWESGPSWSPARVITGSGNRIEDQILVFGERSLDAALADPEAFSELAQ